MTTTIIVAINEITLFGMLFNTEWNYVAKIVPPADITKNYPGFS